jgi:hypothetical protein
MKLKFLLIPYLFVMLILTTCIGLSSTVNNNRTGGSKLKDISVFHQFGDYRNQGVNAPMFSTVWGNIEQENGSLPLENRIRNGRKKVYRVNARGSGGIMFPLHGWGAFSLEQYYENGYIEFDVRGAAGGENFSIGLRSDTRGVVTTNQLSLSSQNIQVTTEWQTVKIPVKNIAADKSRGFKINNITLVELQVPQTAQFYLSEMYIKSPDREKQYPIIKVNQIGYMLNHKKFALISYFPGMLALSANTEFNVINANEQVKFAGRLQPVSWRIDVISGEMVFIADFSELNEPGTYFIRILNSQIDDSYSFIIGNNIYNNLFTDTMKYFYFQRQGIDLEEKYAGIFARKNLHPNDNRVKKYSQRNEPGAPLFDVSGGWYDAGDFGKYFPPAASTVTDLLFAYEFFPHLFSDNQLNIPESGNGVPDFLDEIKWQLDMMLKLEDGLTGSFFEVANYDGDTIFIIDTDGVTGKGNTKSTHATAWAAGVFAHAYIVYKDIPIYKDFAIQCLETAVRAWNYLERNPDEHTWVSGVGRSYFNNATDTAMVKFLGAAALYRATGEEKYQRYVFDNHRRFNYSREFNAYQVVTIGDLGSGFIHYTMSSNPNAAVIRFFEERFRGFETQILRIYNTNNWPTAMVDWAYFWGSSKPIVRIPVELYICNKILNRNTNKSVELLRNAVHYILGINPLSFSFISGHGENSVKDIFSGIFSYDDIDEIPPGYLAGGANQYEAGFMSNYVSKCYIDIDREWTTNEHAIYWNAAMVLCLAAVIGTADIE